MSALALILDFLIQHWFLTLIGVAILYNVIIYPQLLARNKQIVKGKDGTPFVIVLTGGAQGLGKLLSAEFARNHSPNIALIVIDIQQELGLQAVEQLKRETRIESAEYINVDISDELALNEAWKRIISRYGRVNMLINNAARVLGKPFSELSLAAYKKTIDINFISIVQLTKLFLNQEQAKASTTMGEFHLVNINSVGGCQAMAQWSDYGASKFALKGFTQSLRFELADEMPKLAMTNIYPYYINTGMFEGYKPLAERVIPTIDQHDAARRIYAAIMKEEKEVYIWWYLYYLRIFGDLMPMRVSDYLMVHLFSKGMKTFVGRANQEKKYS